MVKKKEISLEDVNLMFITFKGLNSLEFSNFKIGP